MWQLGFFFHEMASSLLSVFLPLYIIAIGGSLVDVGIMSSSAVFLTIPSSFFWGYICDKTGRYKRYILISFLASTVLLYLFTLTTGVVLLIILYAAMSILHVAHEPPKNVLISELYTHEEWEKTFAFYEGFTQTGRLIGLLLGLFMSIYGIGAASTLILCSGLNLVACIMSLILVTDPLLVFERSLVRIEKAIDFTYNGVVIASKILDGLSLNERLKKENLSAFCSGLVLFSLAGSILFTPLPIFFSKELALPASVVFALYMLKSGGEVSGYFLAGSRSSQPAEKSRISRIVIFRSMLAFLLLAVTGMSAYGIALAAVILTLMGFVYALFLVLMLSLSMELIPIGKAGLFNALVGIGGACGSFIGPFFAQTLGFTYVFLTAGIILFLAYVALKIFT
ncbi:MAG: MFS transporter [Candidatus Bathyarchaeota archaeon]|nr:MFS transporter [Candidatus Bathyarchaeota archaeon]